MLWASTLGGIWALYKSLLLLLFSELRLRLKKNSLQRQFHFHHCVVWTTTTKSRKQTCSTAKLFATVVRTGPNHSLQGADKALLATDLSQPPYQWPVWQAEQSICIRTHWHQSWSSYAHSPTLCGQVDRVYAWFLFFFNSVLSQGRCNPRNIATSRGENKSR